MKLGLSSALRDAFERPKLELQKAYVRFAHTLAAAAVIGAATVLFSETRWSVGVTVRMLGLLLGGLVCFALGAVLSKGE